MITFHIELQAHAQKRMNGDRAPTTTPCTKWIVAIFAEDRHINAIELDEWDSFHCHIDTSGDVEKRARDYATKLQNVLGAMPYTVVNYVDPEKAMADAAPDLLAACKEFVRKVDHGEAQSEGSYNQMKTAIDKATGRVPR